MIADQIRLRIGRSWEGITPGFHLRVIKGGLTIADECFGVTYPTYDWASLTKMVLTHTLLMKCIDEGMLHEDDLVGKYLPELKQNSELRLRHLLSHTAGLPASIGFWNKCPADSMLVADEWRKQVLSLEMKPTTRSSYTELDFQVLGYVLEKLLGDDIESHWEKLSQALGLTQTHFRPLNKQLMGTSMIAPTEMCPLRGRRIQGEVHHPDIWLNGGVGWLAGLFGPMEDFATWSLGLRSAYYRQKNWVVGSDTLGRFTKREVGNSSLGYMMPKTGRRDGQKYYLSSGKKFGSHSIGHTGFTGPMFWFDPERDLIVLILTNRTFPSAANERWFDYRGVVHDEVIAAIEEEILNSNKKENLL